MRAAVAMLSPAKDPLLETIHAIVAAHANPTINSFAIPGTSTNNAGHYGGNHGSTYSSPVSGVKVDSETQTPPSESQILGNFSGGASPSTPKSHASTSTPRKTSPAKSSSNLSPVTAKLVFRTPDSASSAKSTNSKQKAKKTVPSAGASRSRTRGYSYLYYSIL